MKSDATSISFEPRLTKAGSFGFLPNGEIGGPIMPATWERSFTDTLSLVKIMLRRILRDEVDLLEAAHRAERQTWMCQSIGNLPLIDHTIVRLCEFEEHSTKQAAQLLRMTPIAVKSRRFRARHLLAEHFFKQHDCVNASVVDLPQAQSTPSLTAPVKNES